MSQGMLQNPNLKISLKKRLSDAKKVAVLCVGSELRGDDIAGILVARELERHFDDSHPHIRVMIGGTAPENLTGEIKKFRPSHLLIVDCAEMGLNPGDMMLLEAECSGGVPFSTHSVPIKFMVDYLNESIPIHTVVVGIQPKSLVFGQCPSQEVKDSVKILADAIREIADAFEKK